MLSRIRSRLGRTRANQAGASARVEAHLAARAPGPLPRPAADLVASFRAKSEKLSSTVADVARFTDVPEAVARYLATTGLPRSAVCWPEISLLDWSSSGIRVEARPARDDDLVGITGCFCALAETGSLMLCSSPQTPATPSLLPETHVAVVYASRIVAGMEEAWALARAELGELPRAVNFVSGPSRTADIEQTIVLGAHGPYRVHLLIVGAQ